MNVKDDLYSYEWNVYKFQDSSGLTSIDFENELRSNHFPAGNIIVNGKVDNQTPKVNDPTMIIGAQISLKVSKSGLGSGTVTSSPAGINCGGSCSAVFNEGAAVILKATPSPGSGFVGWEGCGQAQGNTCTLTMNASATLTAMFDRLPGSAGNMGLLPGVWLLLK